MSDSRPARLADKDDKRTFLQRLSEFLHPGPDSTAELIETLAEAEDNNVIGTESRAMLEGVIRMADMSAGDVMVPATRMDLVNIDASPDVLLQVVIDTAHSRFPVYEGEHENIIGILLAKDLLKLQRAPEFSIRALLRPAVFVPESKGERFASGVSRQPQSPRHRDRRIWPGCGPDHHRGRARTDRWRD